MPTIASRAKPSVLILCTGNSCRSQIAEAIWRHMAGDRWEVASAGTKPAGYVHPLAVKVLSESGISADQLHSKSVESMRGRSFDYVIAVCDGASESCPAGAKGARRILWPLPDPAKPNPSEESLADFRSVRDRLHRRIEAFIRRESGQHEALPASIRQAAPAMNAREIRSAARLVRRAIREDLNGEIDVTSAAVVPESARGSARFVCRADGVICGLGICQWAVAEFGTVVTFTPLLRDGARAAAGTAIATIAGPARSILLLERTCLNFLGRLSGISSLTARFVEAIKPHHCSIMDTRKTTPGWRLLEKYAVRCGGGRNQRMGLFDGILIKDNHLALARQSAKDAADSTIGQVIEQARSWLARNPRHGGPPIPLEVEVDSVDELRAALIAKPDIILLDNMSPETLRECVALRNQMAPEVLLEASGGVTLENVASIAASGVDRISIGALTHSASNFDIGLDWSAGGES